MLGIADISTHEKGKKGGQESSPKDLRPLALRRLETVSCPPASCPLILLRVMMETWEEAILVGLRGKGDDKDTSMACWSVLPWLLRGALVERA